MRIYILLLSILVIVLAVLILRVQPEPARAGPAFPARAFIGDAVAGESVTYRDEAGFTVAYWVEMVRPGGLDRPPWIRIRTAWRDPSGQPVPGAAEVYNHFPTRHGLYPLTAPADPQGHDRVWVWSRIRRMDLEWQGERRELWRVDLVDPALPSEAGQDHVVAWMDETVPVFGLVRWQRHGRTWDLVDRRPQ